MNLLLDTHAILWFFLADPKLSATARTTIEDAANRKYVSTASCWEIAIKAGAGKLRLAEPSGILLRREITRNNFLILNVSLEHAAAVESLPHHHRDPFDRLLIAQAQMEGLTLVSADVMFDQYGVSRLWLRPLVCRLR